MGKILDAFARDELYVDTVTERRDPKHQKLYETICTLQTKLEERLNDEETELLNRLIDTMSEEYCYCSQDRFIRGYRLGILMMVEVLSGQDSFVRT